MSSADKLWIDFETYSRVDIKKQGGKQYCTSDTTQVICLGYAFNDEPVELWTPAQMFPQRVAKHVEGGGKVYAHNILFDRRIWNNVLCRDFDNTVKLPLGQCVDTVALCQTYTLPASLKAAGEAMCIALPKLETGVRLIKKCCNPDKNGKQPQYHQLKLEFQELFKYCKRDVEAMRMVVNSLPRQELIPIEQKIWELTAQMNEQGLPIDTEAVTAILKYLSKYSKERMKQVALITSGQVNTVNQIQKIKEWCEEQNYVLDNMQADTIIRVLEDVEAPEQVKKLLRLRQELGRTSTAKYKKINELVIPGSTTGTVYDNLQFHNSTTGRWGGRGFQMQNLPRASVPYPEEMIEKFKTGEDIHDPVGVSKALIRPMIKAPSGQILIVSDYSSIENRALAWLANDKETLKGFADNFDQYKDMASTVYQVPYDRVNKEQRQIGKIIILGCGYQMGARRFKEVCTQWGVVVSDEEAKHLVGVYREKYHLVKSMWYNLQKAVVRAVLSGQRQKFNLLNIGTATVNGIRWLAVQLPSGKAIYYMQPQVEERPIPGFESMGPVPTVTKMGMNSYTRKWTRLAVSPGTLTENAVQATAREIMAQGMLNVAREMPEITLSLTVHDELGGTIDRDLATLETMTKFNKCLCSIPWASGLPLEAEGYFSRRYKK